MEDTITIFEIPAFLAASIRWYRWEYDHRTTGRNHTRRSHHCGYRIPHGTTTIHRDVVAAAAATGWWWRCVSLMTLHHRLHHRHRLITSFGIVGVNTLEVGGSNNNSLFAAIFQLYDFAQVYFSICFSFFHRNGILSDQSWGEYSWYWRRNCLGNSRSIYNFELSMQWRR